MKTRTTVYISETLHALARLEHLNLSFMLEQTLVDRLGGTREQIEDRALKALEEHRVLNEMALLASSKTERIQSIGLRFLKDRAGKPFSDKLNIDWIESLKPTYGFGKRMKPEEIYDGIRAFLATSPDAIDYRHKQHEAEKRRVELQKKLDSLRAAKLKTRGPNNGR